MSHDILDLPDERPKSRTFSWLGYAALGLLIAGMAFRLMYWPFANLMVVAGGAGMVLRNVLVVVLNRPVIWRVVLYYFGYSMLVWGMVGVWLSRGDFYRYLIVAAVGVFFVQFVWPKGKAQ